MAQSAPLGGLVFATKTSNYQVARIKAMLSNLLMSPLNWLKRMYMVIGVAILLIVCELMTRLKCMYIVNCL